MSETDIIFDTLLNLHKGYMCEMFQKSGNTEEFAEWNVRADTVRKCLNAITSSLPAEKNKKYKKDLKNRIDTMCEVFFMTEDENGDNISGHGG